MTGGNISRCYSEKPQIPVRTSFTKELQGFWLV